MIGIDTNVLVRYFAQDDPVQSPIAAAFLDALTPDNPGYVTQVVLAELVWVLSKGYGQASRAIIEILEGLLACREIVVEASHTVRSALHAFAASTAGFTDCLIHRACKAAGCDRAVTFDREAARTAGFHLLQ